MPTEDGARLARCYLPPTSQRPLAGATEAGPWRLNPTRAWTLDFVVAAAPTDLTQLIPVLAVRHEDGDHTVTLTLGAPRRTSIRVARPRAGYFSLVPPPGYVARTPGEWAAFTEARQQWEWRYTVYAPPTRPVVPLPAPDSPTDHCLVTASGAGRHALLLAGLGWHVTAVDFDRRALSLMMDTATGRGVERRVTPVHADLVRWLQSVRPPQPWDLVVASHSLGGLSPRLRRAVTALIAAHSSPSARLSAREHSRLITEDDLTALWGPQVQVTPQRDGHHLVTGRLSTHGHTASTL